jgi:hypothetical protein
VPQAEQLLSAVGLAGLPNWGMRQHHFQHDFHRRENTHETAPKLSWNFCGRSAGQADEELPEVPSPQASSLTAAFRKSNGLHVRYSRPFGSVFDRTCSSNVSSRVDDTFSKAQGRGTRDHPLETPLFGRPLHNEISSTGHCANAAPNIICADSDPGLTSWGLSCVRSQTLPQTRTIRYNFEPSLLTDGRRRGECQ